MGNLEESRFHTTQVGSSSPGRSNRLDGGSPGSSISSFSYTFTAAYCFFAQNATGGAQEAMKRAPVSLLLKFHQRDWNISGILDQTFSGVLSLLPVLHHSFLVGVHCKASIPFWPAWATISGNTLCVTWKYHLHITTHLFRYYHFALERKKILKQIKRKVKKFTVYISFLSNGL